MFKIFSSSRGSAAFDIVIFAAVIIFVIFPVFSMVYEKYIIVTEGQIIKDAIDMANISTYNALNNRALGKDAILFNNEEMMSIYRGLLGKNLKLDGSLTPEPGSIAEDTVTINSLVCYTEELPAVCPNGNSIKRPSIHSLVTVPVRPVLFRQIILELLGKEYVELKVHVDSELPVNN